MYIYFLYPPPRLPRLACWMVLLGLGIGFFEINQLGGHMIRAPPTPSMRVLGLPPQNLSFHNRNRPGNLLSCGGVHWRGRNFFCGVLRSAPRWPRPWTTPSKPIVLQPESTRKFTFVWGGILACPQFFLRGPVFSAPAHPALGLPPQNPSFYNRNRPGKRLSCGGGHLRGR